MKKTSTSKARERQVVLEKRVGWTLRCNFYCLDHPPEITTKSEKEDLVEIFAGRPAVEWANDDCADCGRTLGAVAHGDENIGATILLRAKGLELSVSISVCDVPRDRKKLSSLIGRVAGFLVRWGLHRGLHVGVSSSLVGAAGGGYTTRTVSARFNGGSATEELRSRLARKLADWGAGDVDFDPPLSTHAAP